MSDELDLTPDPMLNRSAWSNWTRVILGREAITIDFATLDPLDESKGAFIARMVLPLGAAFELRDALNAVMAGYTDRGRHPPED